MTGAIAPNGSLRLPSLRLPPRVRPLAATEEA